MRFSTFVGIRTELLVRTVRGLEFRVVFYFFLSLRTFIFIGDFVEESPEGEAQNWKNR